METKIDLSKIIGDRSLSDAERSVLLFMVQHIDEVRAMGVRAISRECLTSTSTVMRLAKKLGYDGFVDMCYQLKSALSSRRGIQTDHPIITSNAGVQTRALPHDMSFPIPEATFSTMTDVAKLLRGSRGMTHVYGCGFSSITAIYLAKKLLGLGVRALQSSADDSIAIFENNLERTDSLIVFSRSGRTKRVLDRVAIAADEGICTIAFTGDHPSPLHDACDFSLTIPDEHPLDDRNTDLATYFPCCFMLIEYLVHEYQGLLFS